MVVLMFIHVGGGPTNVRVDLIIVSVGRQDALIFIYLKKCVIETALLASAGSLLLCCIVGMCQPRPSLLCDHCNNGSFARCYSGL
jgi:hypothetical protein